MAQLREILVSSAQFLIFFKICKSFSNFLGFGLKRAASCGAEKEARNHATCAVSVEIGRFWKVGNVRKSARNVCRSVSRLIRSFLNEKKADIPRFFNR
jgi:hypothetical protein